MEYNKNNNKIIINKLMKNANDIAETYSQLALYEYQGQVKTYNYEIYFNQLKLLISTEEALLNSLSYNYLNKLDTIIEDFEEEFRIQKNYRPYDSIALQEFKLLPVQRIYNRLVNLLMQKLSNFPIEKSLAILGKMYDMEPIDPEDEDFDKDDISCIINLSTSLLVDSLSLFANNISGYIKSGQFYENRAMLTKMKYATILVFSELEQCFVGRYLDGNNYLYHPLNLEKDELEVDDVSDLIEDTLEEEFLVELNHLLHIDDEEIKSDKRSLNESIFRESLLRAYLSLLGPEVLAENFEKYQIAFDNKNDIYKSSHKVVYQIIKSSFMMAEQKQKKLITLSLYKN